MAAIMFPYTKPKPKPEPEPEAKFQILDVMLSSLPYSCTNERCLCRRVTGDISPDIAGLEDWQEDSRELGIYGAEDSSIPRIFEVEDSEDNLFFAPPFFSEESRWTPEKWYYLKCAVSVFWLCISRTDTATLTSVRDYYLKKDAFWQKTEYKPTFLRMTEGNYREFFYGKKRKLTE